MLVYRFCKIVHHLQWVQRLGIIIALLLIMLTFLNIVWQEVRKCGLIVLNSLSTHCHASRKCTRSP